MFQKATKRQARLRLALIGPAGSGKTYTALSIARHLGAPVALVDTEHGSASKYADLFDFDTLELESFHPQKYIEAIRAAEAGGYAVLILDSLSHAWMGKDGALELVDRAAKRSQSQNTFAAWRDVTPLHHQLVDTILGARLHIIATMRTKTEYVQEKDDRGKTVIRKIGLQPVQRDGLEYEFDVVADLDQDNSLIIGKTRCPALHGKLFSRAGQNIAGILVAWLTDGAPAPEPRRNGQAWTTNPKVLARFWAYCIEHKALGERDVLAALQVARLEDYAGSMEEAKAAIESYIARQAAGNGQQSPL